MDSPNQKPIHLVCPKCHYEFEYDANYYDRKIAALKMEVADIIKQLEVFKAKYHPDFRTNRWRNQAVKALTIKQRQLTELKEFQRSARQIVESQRADIFIRLVKEAIPQKQYQDLWQQTDDMMRYRTYDTAIQRFSNIPDSVRAEE